MMVIIIIKTVISNNYCRSVFLFVQVMFDVMSNKNQLCSNKIMMVLNNNGCIIKTIINNYCRGVFLFVLGRKTEEIDDTNNTAAVNMMGILIRLVLEKAPNAYEPIMAPILANNNNTPFAVVLKE